MLCRALLQHGYGATYLSHALYDRTLEQAPTFRYVELPAYAGTLDDPKALLAVKMERLRRIMHLRGQVGPFAALICEHYPIGKFYLDEEIGLLRKFFKTAGTRLLCVYRDIIDDGDLALAEQALTRLNRDFDALLVLADPKLLALPAAFAAQVQIPITYLGFLDPHERRKILVFGGGGKLNDQFYQRTLHVLQGLGVAVESTLYTGSLMDDAAFTTLAAQAGPAAQVYRATPDLYAELAQAAITISTLGYNTFLDLLHFNNANILVPLLHNDEQMTRARLLAQMKANVSVLELDEQYEVALAAKLAQIVTSAPNVGGLRNFVREIEESVCL